MILVRSMCRRNAWPRPAPCWAPSIRPGMSATTMRRSPDKLDDAELRLERGERVVGDLRPGGGDRAQQRALAGVGHADQADVGDQLQLEPEVSLLAFGAGLGVARGLVGRRFEMPVAARRPCRPWR